MRNQSSRGPRRRIKQRVQVEEMEPRCLLAANPAISEFATTTNFSRPLAITSAPDGNLWFTEADSNNIGRIDPATGRVTEFPVPTSDSQPTGITSGPEGDVWFTEASGNQIGRITPAGVITEFPIPTPASDPVAITVGPDGNLWFTELFGNQVGQITPAGVVTEFGLPTPLSDPVAITAGPAGTLWVAQSGSNQIGRIVPGGGLLESTVAITEFSIPTSSSDVSGITAGPGGDLWFTEAYGDQIGRITPAGVIREFPVPTSGVQPEGITVGPDGNLWFTEFNGNQIGQMTPGGVVTEFPIPTEGSLPEGITTGPDGNLWFAESQTSQIGRLDPPLDASGATITATEGTPFIGTVATFTDDDPFSVADDFTATIDWTDGTTTEGQVVEEASKTFDVVGSHNFAADGPALAMNVTIADKDGSTTTAASIANVVPEPLVPVAGVLAATEGQPVPAGTVVATFTGGDPIDHYSALIIWGDGHADAATILGGAGEFRVVTASDHTYTEEGTEPIIVTVFDQYRQAFLAESADALGSAVVADASLAATATQPAVTASKAALFQGAVASFTDANPGATAPDFTATIDWGDGPSQSAGTVSRSGGVFTVSGQHVYSQEGTYPITVTIHDAGGSVLTTATAATIADVAPLISGIPVSMTKKNQFTTPVAYIVEPVGALAEPANQFTATINWGDGTTSSGTVEAVPGGDWVVGTHTYAGSGPYTVTVNVTASDGFKVSTTTTANDPPRVPAGPRHHRHARPVHHRSAR